MGAPEVISIPSKSYVAINSYKSDRSLPPILCDLGRVSNIAAAVTLPRTANFVTRNNVAQSIRSLSHNKRPISEVLDCSNSNSGLENAPTEISTTNAVDSHKRRRYAIKSQASTSALTIPSTVKTDLDRNYDSNPQAKIMKLKTTNASSMVSSPDVTTANIPKINSVSHQHNTQRNLNTRLPSSQLTSSPPQTLFLQPVQLRSQETETHSHLKSNQFARSNGPNTTQLPYQLSLQLPTPGMEQLPTHHSLQIQLQQQNQQLSNENVQLQKQLSLFRQLIKNPQRLSQVLTRLEQRHH